jgi:5-(carboxyamino)imidazole ribonucleotide mutase
MSTSNTLVSILMGSDSDLPTMKEAAAICDEFGIGYEMKVISAHRTPHLLSEYVAEAEKKGIKVIIAGAGGAAHLPGVAAAFTILPVIGIPIKTSTLNGMDSLYSIVQMPPGIPVATVAIGGGKNAGILAMEILAVGNEELSNKMRGFKKKIANESMKKNEGLADKMKG